MNALDLTYERLKTSEAVRKFAYNDADGTMVSCMPSGNLTIAIGVNLEVGLDDEEVEWLSKHRLHKAAVGIAGFAWFQGCNPVRQSVLLEIAFNTGVAGLLQFKRMLAAIQREDWPVVQRECHVADPRLEGRYKRLGEILLRGEI